MGRGSNPMRGLLHRSDRPHAPCRQYRGDSQLAPIGSRITREDSTLIYMQVHTPPSAILPLMLGSICWDQWLSIPPGKCSSYRHFCEATPSSGPTMDRDSGGTCSRGRTTSLSLRGDGGGGAQENGLHGVGVQVLGVDDETGAKVFPDVHGHQMNILNLHTATTVHRSARRHPCKIPSHARGCRVTQRGARQRHRARFRTSSS